MIVAANPLKVPRAGLAEWAAALRADGWLIQAIADELEVSRSYASQLIHDPDGSRLRARKDSYRGVCEDCGGPTGGSDGPPAARCVTCIRVRRHADRYWTRDTIVRAFRAFHVRFGRSPATTDINGRCPSQSPRYSPERRAEIEAIAASGFRLPVPWLVAREFGSWNTALDAAGLPRNPNGGAGRRKAAA